MTAVVPFDFDGQLVRSVLIQDEPWFVAGDVARILGYQDSYYLTRGLDEDEKAPHILGTPGGSQQTTVISESGLYSAILRSRVEPARRFKRWVTSEVLPAIRRTGSYEVERLTPLQLAERLVDAERRAEAATQRAAELEGPAASWEHFASTDGDLSVNEAAKVLSRHPGIAIGERRLWTWLDEHRWTYRDAAGDRRAYQDRIESGHLTARARGHHHPATGEWVVDAPQVRVPMRGVELLRKHLAPQLTVVPAVVEGPVSAVRVG